SFKGGALKSDALEAIATTSGPLTIFFDGHGAKDIIALSVDVKITAQELAEALMRRARSFPDAKSAKVLMAGCHSYDFNRTGVLRYMVESGVEKKDLPYMFSLAPKQGFSWGEAASDALEEILNISGNGPVNTGHILFDAEGTSAFFLNDFGAFVPDFESGPDQAPLERAGIIIGVPYTIPNIQPAAQTPAAYEQDEASELYRILQEGAEDARIKFMAMTGVDPSKPLSEILVDLITLTNGPAYNRATLLQALNLYGALEATPDEKLAQSVLEIGFFGAKTAAEFEGGVNYSQVEMLEEAIASRLNEFKLPATGVNKYSFTLSRDDGKPVALEVSVRNDYNIPTMFDVNRSDGREITINPGEIAKRFGEDRAGIIADAIIVHELAEALGIQMGYSFVTRHIASMRLEAQLAPPGSSARQALIPIWQARELGTSAFVYGNKVFKTSPLSPVSSARDADRKKEMDRQRKISASEKFTSTYTYEERLKELFQLMFVENMDPAVIAMKMRDYGQEDSVTYGMFEIAGLFRLPKETLNNISGFEPNARKALDMIARLPELHEKALSWGRPSGRGYSNLDNEIYSPVIRNAIDTSRFAAIRLTGPAGALFGERALVMDDGNIRPGNIVLNAEQISNIEMARGILAQEFPEDLDLLASSSAAILFIEGLDESVSRRLLQYGRAPPGCYGTHYGLSRPQYYLDQKLLNDPQALARHLHHEIQEREAVLRDLEPAERDVVLNRTERSRELLNKIATLAAFKHQALVAEEEIRRIEISAAVNRAVLERFLGAGTLERFLNTIRSELFFDILINKALYSQGARQAALLKALELSKKGELQPEEIALYIRRTFIDGLGEERYGIFNTVGTEVEIMRLFSSGYRKDDVVKVYQDLLGMPRGMDEIIEFAFSPSYSWRTQAEIISSMENLGMINPSDQVSSNPGLFNSMHISCIYIDNMENVRGINMLARYIEFSKMFLYSSRERVDYFVRSRWKPIDKKGGTSNVSDIAGKKPGRTIEAGPGQAVRLEYRSGDVASFGRQYENMLRFTHLWHGLMLQTIRAAIAARDDVNRPITAFEYRLTSIFNDFFVRIGEIARDDPNAEKLLAQNWFDSANPNFSRMLALKGNTSLASSLRDSIDAMTVAVENALDEIESLDAAPEVQPETFRDLEVIKFLNSNWVDGVTGEQMSSRDIGLIDAGIGATLLRHPGAAEGRPYSITRHDELILDSITPSLRNMSLTDRVEFIRDLPGSIRDTAIFRNIDRFARIFPETASWTPAGSEIFDASDLFRNFEQTRIIPTDWIDRNAQIFNPVRDAGIIPQVIGLRTQIQNTIIQSLSIFIGKGFAKVAPYGFTSMAFMFASEVIIKAMAFLGYISTDQVSFMIAGAASTALIILAASLGYRAYLALTNRGYLTSGAFAAADDHALRLRVFNIFSPGRAAAAGNLAGINADRDISIVDDMRSIGLQSFQHEIAELLRLGIINSTSTPSLLRSLTTDQILDGLRLGTISSQPASSALNRFETAGFCHLSENNVLYTYNRPVLFGNLLGGRPDASRVDNAFYDGYNGHLYIKRSAARTHDVGLELILGHEKGKRAFLQNRILSRFFGRRTAEFIGNIYEAAAFLRIIAARTNGPLLLVVGSGIFIPTAIIILLPFFFVSLLSLGSSGIFHHAMRLSGRVWRIAKRTAEIVVVIALMVSINHFMSPDRAIQIDKRPAVVDVMPGAQIAPPAKSTPTVEEGEISPGPGKDREKGSRDAIEEDSRLRYIERVWQDVRPFVEAMEGGRTLSYEKNERLSDGHLAPDPAVAGLQQALSVLGYQLDIDGKFGIPQTRKSVKAFQIDHGLKKRDGKVGPETGPAIIEALKENLSAGLKTGAGLPWVSSSSPAPSGLNPASSSIGKVDYVRIREMRDIPGADNKVEMIATARRMGRFNEEEVVIRATRAPPDAKYANIAKIARTRPELKWLDDEITKFLKSNPDLNDIIIEEVVLPQGSALSLSDFSGIAILKGAPGNVPLRALSEQLYNNPIARFHELAHLVLENNPALARKMENHLRGRASEKLDSMLSRLPKFGFTDNMRSHYILRALQWHAFGDMDLALTAEIRAMQADAMRSSVASGAVIEDHGYIRDKSEVQRMQTLFNMWGLKLDAIKIVDTAEAMALYENGVLYISSRKAFYEFSRDSLDKDAFDYILKNIVFRNYLANYSKEEDAIQYAAEYLFAHYKALELRRPGEATENLLQFKVLRNSVYKFLRQAGVPELGRAKQVVNLLKKTPVWHDRLVVTGEDLAEALRGSVFEGGVIAKALASKLATGDMILFNTDRDRFSLASKDTAYFIREAIFAITGSGMKEWDEVSGIAKRLAGYLTENTKKTGGFDNFAATAANLMRPTPTITVTPAPSAVSIVGRPSPATAMSLKKTVVLGALGERERRPAPEISDSTYGYSEEPDAEFSSGLPRSSVYDSAAKRETIYILNDSGYEPALEAMERGIDSLKAGGLTEHEKLVIFARDILAKYLVALSIVTAQKALAMRAGAPAGQAEVAARRFNEIKGLLVSALEAKDDLGEEVFGQGASEFKGLFRQLADASADVGSIDDNLFDRIRQCEYSVTNNVHIAVEAITRQVKDGERVIDCSFLSMTSHAIKSRRSVYSEVGMLPIYYLGDRLDLINKDIEALGFTYLGEKHGVVVSDMIQVDLYRRTLPRLLGRQTGSHRINALITLALSVDYGDVDISDEDILAKILQTRENSTAVHEMDHTIYEWTTPQGRMNRIETEALSYLASIWRGTAEGPSGHYTEKVPFRYTDMKDASYIEEDQFDSAFTDLLKILDLYIEGPVPFDLMQIYYNCNRVIVEMMCRHMGIEARPNFKFNDRLWNASQILEALLDDGKFPTAEEKKENLKRIAFDIRQEILSNPSGINWSGLGTLTQGAPSSAPAPVEPAGVVRPPAPGMPKPATPTTVGPVMPGSYTAANITTPFAPEELVISTSGKEAPAKFTVLQNPINRALGLIIYNLNMRLTSMLRKTIRPVIAIISIALIVLTVYFNLPKNTESSTPAVKPSPVMEVRQESDKNKTPAKSSSGDSSFIYDMANTIAYPSLNRLIPMMAQELPYSLVQSDELRTKLQQLAGIDFNKVIEGPQAQILLLDVAPMVPEIEGAVRDLQAALWDMRLLTQGGRPLDEVADGRFGLMTHTALYDYNKDPVYRTNAGVNKAISDLMDAIDKNANPPGALSAGSVMPSKGNLGFLRTFFIDRLGLSRELSENLYVPLVEESIMFLFLALVPGDLGIITYLASRAIFVALHAAQDTGIPGIGVFQRIFLPSLYSGVGVISFAALSYLGIGGALSLSFILTLIFHASGNWAVDIFSLSFRKGILGWKGRSPSAGKRENYDTQKGSPRQYTGPVHFVVGANKFAIYHKTQLPPHVKNRTTLLADSLYVLVNETDPVNQWVERQFFQDGSRNMLNIGRSSGNGLVLNDELVSREHARVTVNGNLISVKDLGSKNGTQAYCEIFPEMAKAIEASESSIDRGLDAGRAVFAEGLSLNASLPSGDIIYRGPVKIFLSEDIVFVVYKYEDMPEFYKAKSAIPEDDREGYFLVDTKATYRYVKLSAKPVTVGRDPAKSGFIVDAGIVPADQL
ncbi:MAG TPA: peptidoglycan-binding protein, partial [Candidatus Omnitrophota bacterium]|nr:peptidoglycan-binding protein [Candidatus Omnitrophota bacterium]